MAQFGRPSTDTYNGDGWVEDDSSSTDMFQEIDEVSASDTDYIQSALAPTNDPYVTKLSTMEDPVSATGHIIRWRRRKSSTGGAVVDLTVELRQGYVNESTLGTLICTIADATLPDAFTDTSYTLSAGEANSITDYTSLFLRFVANQV